jgi:diguanylate cyclase (GGDEF)-like protein
MLLAQRDSLTNVLTHDAFWQRLASELSRGQPVGVIELDIRDLCALNDRLGHPAGDEILIAVARRLNGAVSEEDVVARLGGDEFAVLANCVAGDAEELALLEREIEDAVSSEPFLVDGEEVHVGVTVSAGVLESIVEFGQLFS